MKMSSKSSVLESFTTQWSPFEANSLKVVPNCKQTGLMTPEAVLLEHIHVYKSEKCAKVSRIANKYTYIERVFSRCQQLWRPKDKNLRSTG